MDQPITWVLLAALVGALIAAAKTGFWLREYFSKAKHELRNDMLSQKADLIVEIGDLEKAMQTMVIRIQALEVLAQTRAGMRDDIDDIKERLRELERSVKNLEINEARRSRDDDQRRQR